MKLWLNFVGYEIVWFVAVIGAARGLTWPGVLAVALFALWQCAVSSRRLTELKLMALAVGCGLVFDGFLAASGMVRYAVPYPSLPPGGAPLWILALWVAFALTLTQCLRYLQKNLWVAALFGGVGGPLVFWCAGRAWGVVHFPAPSGHELTALAVGWGLAMPLLAGMARRWSAGTPRPWTEATHEHV